MTDSGPVISILRHARSEMTGMFVWLRARTIASLNRLLTANSFAERHPRSSPVVAGGGIRISNALFRQGERKKPKLRFTILSMDVYVHSGFLPGREVEPESALSKHHWTPR